MEEDPARRWTDADIRARGLSPERVRRWFHAGAPRCHEDIKWGMPAFMQERMLGGMSAFKAHVSIGFPRGGELDDPSGLQGRATS